MNEANEVSKGVKGRAIASVGDGANEVSMKSVFPSEARIE